MAASQMKDLLKHELGDLLYAEQLILKMLGTLTREVRNPEVLARVQEHIGETEEQIERLRRAFELVGEKAKAETCEAAVGLKAEHDSFKKEENPSKALLEAFDLGNGLRVEHYEIAGYRSAIAVATAMGEREVAALLGESLREEEAMASFIERNSVKALKALGTGMDLATGAAEVTFTPAQGGSSARKSGGSSGSKSAGRAGGSKSNGRSTADTGSGGRSSSSSGGSKSSGGRSTASKSSNGASKSSASSKSSGGTRSANRSSGGSSSSSRTTAERSGSKSGGSSSSKSGGSSSKSGGSSSKSGGSKSSGSKSSGSKSGSSRSRSGGGARA